jgi:hypothetical protein
MPPLSRRILSSNQIRAPLAWLRENTLSFQFISFTMRLRILSDLHREFGPTEIPRMDADGIILAGDIDTKQTALPWIREFTGNTPTAYICGNHEFYGDKLPRVTERLAEMTAGSNVHLLEDSFITVGDWHIYGCTLWTDMAIMEDWQSRVALAEGAMNDYKRIRNSNRGYKRLSPKDTRSIHLRSLVRIEQFFANHDPARTIVVTHHAPSGQSLPPESRSDPLNCAYASDLEEFILRHQPPLWIHGHIHHSSDYHIGKTRVLANPQGYPQEPNPHFNPLLIIDL